MYCPQCGAQPPDELKFCNQCGANLYAVRQVVASREVDDKFDWSKTWVAEMFMSDAERKRRNADLDRRRGITADVKRYNEIKAGVITSCVGLGVMIFLAIFMEGIIRSSQVWHGEEQILSRIWITGVIPLLIGLGIVFNGLIVSRKIVEIEKRGDALGGRDAFGGTPERPSLRSADTSEFVPAGYSVTENTTKNLASPFENK